MKVVLIIILHFASFTAYCQNSKSAVAIQLDSLKSELTLTRNDSMRAILLLQLTSNYTRTNPDSAIHYGEKAFEFAIKNSYIGIAVSVLGFVGDAYHSKGNLPKGLEVCLQAIALSEELPPSEVGMAVVASSTLGDIHTDLGNYRQAIHFYDEMLELQFPGELDRLGDAFHHFGRASVYEKMNILDSALYELKLSEKYFDESPVDMGYRYPKIYPVVPSWFNLRSRVFVKQGNIDLALKDLNTTLNLTLKNDEPYYSANSYNEIASLYTNLKSQDSAIYFAKKGLQEANRISYTGGILAASEILADQLDSVNDTEALYYLKLANRMRNQLYGASNIQLMKDMIAGEEKRQKELVNTEAAYQNKLKVNGLLGLALILTLITVFLIRNNRNKQKAKQKIESAFNQLKSAQSQLVQSEKMASLGELTAGIAHEIQNPLNFVNNFSEVSKELIGEMKEELEKGDIGEAKEIAEDIDGNLEKIHHHGQRASGIVKGMLEHSRTSDGKKEPTDINALADEYLRLAYHGLRAKDKSFNSDFSTDFDETLPKINVISQDIGRVLLNLINNAFYAVNQKAVRHSDPERSEGVESGVAASHDGYQPEVIVSTKLSLSGGGQGEVRNIQISVKDNGEGIPGKVRDKIFQPFFTTKPTGSGTGLGLSLSYDIVKAHGGELKVESEEGGGTEFCIVLPII